MGGRLLKMRFLGTPRVLGDFDGIDRVPAEEEGKKWLLRGIEYLRLRR